LGYSFAAMAENPTGHLAPDGSLYANLTGNAAILLQVCPELLRAAEGRPKGSLDVETSNSMTSSTSSDGRVAAFGDKAFS